MRVAIFAAIVLLFAIGVAVVYMTGSVKSMHGIIGSFFVTLTLVVMVALVIGMIGMAWEAAGDLELALSRWKWSRVRRQNWPFE